MSVYEIEYFCQAQLQLQLHLSLILTFNTHPATHHLTEKVVNHATSLNLYHLRLRSTPTLTSTKARVEINITIQFSNQPPNRKSCWNATLSIFSTPDFDYIFHLNWQLNLSFIISTFIDFNIFPIFIPLRDPPCCSLAFNIRLDASLMLREGCCNFNIFLSVDGPPFAPFLLLFLSPLMTTTSIFFKLIRWCEISEILVL